MNSSQRLFHVMSTVAATLLSTTALAQSDELSGNRIRFGVGTELSRETNAGMERPAEADTNSFKTLLDFGLTRETKTQRLDLDSSVALEFADGPDGEVRDLSDPDLRIFYEAQGSRSAFRSSTRVDEQDVSTLTSVYDEETGEVSVTPDDGRRRIASQSVTLEVLKDMPVELDLSADRSNVAYTDTTSPNYYDSDTVGGSITARTRLTPVATLNSTLAYRFHEADNVQNTERETRDAEAGITYDLAPDSTLNFAAGYTAVDTTTAADDDTEEGATFNLGFSKELTRGTAGIALDREIAATGARDEISVSRLLEMPGGSLAGELGYSTNEDGDGSWVGEMSYTHAFKRSALAMNLTRDVTTSDTNGDRVVSQLGSNWNYELNGLSQLSLSGTYGEVDYIDGATPTAWQSNVALDYDHQLTRDWQLTTGVSQRRNMQEGLDDAISNRVYLRLSRDFSFGM